MSGSPSGIRRRHRRPAASRPPCPRCAATAASRTAGMAQQRGFHLAQLDAVAADLHLLVQPSQELDRAVGQPSAAVARPVEPAAGDVAERVGEESLGRQLRGVQIAARQPRAADVQLARHARGDRLAIRVEDVRLHVGDGPADRDRAAAVRRDGRPTRWRPRPPRSGRRGCTARRRAARTGESGGPAASPRRRSRPSATSGRPSAAGRRASPAAWRAGLPGSSRPPSPRARAAGAGRTPRPARPGPSAPRTPARGRSVPATGRTCTAGCSGRRRRRGPVRSRSRHRIVLQMARCSTITPLGRPVEPEV